MGRWTNGLSMVETAAMATSTLLSMGSSLHADPEKNTKPKEYREWFAVVLGEMEKALDARESMHPNPAYDEWLTIPNEPDLTPSPPHDEMAPEDEPLPVEDHEQTYSLMAAFGDSSPF